jgi:hypothetical protein
METQTYRFIWRGFEIKAMYTPLRWNTIAHLEVRSLRPEWARLPVPEAGYRSNFQQLGTVEGRTGDVVAWLDEETISSEWQCTEMASRQLSLF